jgi:transketolase
MNTLISTNELKNLATDLRKHIISMIYKAQSGHPGGSLSIVEFVTACYFKYMNVDPKNPRWENRDRFVLSKGHACPAQYSALAMKGFFDIEVLNTLREEGSILQGHPDMKKCPGIDISTGSLGQGLSCAVGMALAAKRDDKDYNVFCIIGDGESQEGMIWEGLGVANKYQLDNLIVFIDNNNLQIDGTVEEVLPVLDLGKKFSLFGFEVYEVNGNSMEEIDIALGKAISNKNRKPKAIFGHTVKGKGVSYMENMCNWHGIAPNDEEYERAMLELDQQYV